MTTLELLLDAKLPGGLRAYVSDRRKLGESWARIAHQIFNDVNIWVSGETLRKWFSGESAGGGS